VVQTRSRIGQQSEADGSLRSDGRERILDEARALFLERGFTATSMQDIADAVGMTKPALYYHFRDKQELFLAVIAREMDEGKRAFLEILSTDGTLAERLETGATWCFTRIRGDMGRMMSDMHRVLPAERVHDFKCANPMPVEMVAHMLEMGKLRGEISEDEDTTALARLFVGMIFGQLAMQSSHEIAQIDPERIGKLVARVFIHGITGC
jgi:AcrR family transcriptional regulator